MNFDNIDKLTDEEVVQLYQDSDFLSACCCGGPGSAWTGGYFDFQSCNNWCRSIGGTPWGWNLHSASTNYCCTPEGSCW